MVKSVKTRRILTTVFLIALLAAGILFFPVPAAATNDRTQDLQDSYLEQNASERRNLQKDAILFPLAKIQEP